MDTYTYIKPRKYYEDSYDVYTIERCLEMADRLNRKFHKDRAKFKTSNKEFDRQKDLVISITVNVFRTDRFKNRNEWIDQMMNDDLSKQSMIDNAEPDLFLSCKECGSTLQMIGKDLMNDKHGVERVLFLYECIIDSCKKRYGYYDNGEEWKYESPKCPKCSHLLKTKYIKDNPEISVFRSICSNCGYKDDSVHDHKKFQAEQLKDKKRQEKLLELYKDSFCYSEEEGNQAILDIERIGRYQKQANEQIKMEADPTYIRMKKLKILKINELKSLISTECEKLNYSLPNFQNPTTDNYVIIDFVVTDEDSERDEYQSKKNLSTAIKKLLINTNWRLMSTGIEYRLGILHGQLKGFEREQDLYKLAEESPIK